MSELNISIRLSDLAKMPEPVFWNTWDALGDVLKARFGYYDKKPVMAWFDNQAEYEALAQASMG